MTDRIPQRIGDAERDEAAKSLQDHFAAGRITTEELDERLNQALAARTQADLAPLFADLPGAAPGSAPEAASSTNLPWMSPYVSRPNSRGSVQPASPATLLASSRNRIPMLSVWGMLPVVVLVCLALFGFAWKLIGLLYIAVPVYFIIQAVGRSRR